LDELLLHLDAVSEPALVLVVDSLQDPQNFGVLLRSAEGAGVAGVVIPRHRSVGLTPAVAKTSAGASEHLMIADVANLRQAIDALKEQGVGDVVFEAAGRTVSAPTAEPAALAPVPAPADDEIIEAASAEATAPAEKPAPKKRAARPRAKKKTDD